MSKQVLFGAVRYLVAGKDDHDTTPSFVYKLTSLSDPSFADSGLSRNPQIVFYPLVDGKYQFTVAAKDNSGLVDSIRAIDTVIISGASAHTWNDTSWTMLSVPARTYQVDSLSDSAFLVYWDEHDPAHDSIFFNYTSKIPEIEAGKGYWRKSNRNAIVSLSLKDRIDSSVVITLDSTSTGWNQVGSPYWYGVKWTGNGTLWKWNPDTSVGAYQEVANGMMEPWQGYWIQSGPSQSVKINPVPVFDTTIDTTGGLGKRAVLPGFISNSNWNFQVILTARGTRDADNRFGINAAANDHKTALNRQKPPRMGSAPYLFFPHDTKNSMVRYASDFRPQWKSMNVFEIGIDADKGSPSIANISFSGLQKTSDVSLYMMHNDSMVRIENGKSYEVLLKGTTLYRTIFATDSKNAPKLVSFNLNDPYPNPFCPISHMVYSLPYRWDNAGRFISKPYVVQLQIYDIMGRNVRDLVYREQVPGTYSVVWNGKSNTGRLVASGPYFVSLKADNLRSVKKIIMLR